VPLTSKGQKIMANMVREYGPDKGERVFYASRNAGRITGVDPGHAYGGVVGYQAGGLINHDFDPELPRGQDEAQLVPMMHEGYRDPVYLATIRRLIEGQRQLNAMHPVQRELLRRYWLGGYVPGFWLGGYIG
jgi:hypothetical protein